MLIQTFDVRLPLELNHVPTHDLPNYMALAKQPNETSLLTQQVYLLATQPMRVCQTYQHIKFFQHEQDHLKRASLHQLESYNPTYVNKIDQCGRCSNAANYLQSNASYFCDDCR